MAKQIITQKQETIFAQDSEVRRLYKLFNQEFANLSSDNIKFYLEAAQKGINFFKAFLFDEIRRKDLRIAGLCQTRKLSVLKKQWQIESDNEELKQFIDGIFSKFSVSQFLADIIEAQIQGLAVFRLDYDLRDGKLFLRSAEMIPNYATVFQDGLKLVDFSYASLTQLRQQAYSDNPNVNCFDLDPVYFLPVLGFEGVEENGLLNGLIDSIIWGYFFKNYGLKDWSIFLERFATPGVIGKYDPLMNKEDKITLWNAVQNFGNLFKALIPNTAELTTLSDPQKQASGSLFETYMKFWNDELSIRILGQAMTTDTGSGGSFAKAQVGNFIREDLMSGDMALIAQTVNQLIKLIIDINFANVEDYPKFKFVEQEDLDAKSKTADIFVKIHNAGFDIDPEDIAETFGLTVTQTAPPPAPSFVNTNLSPDENGNPADTSNTKPDTQNINGKFTESLPPKKKKEMIEELLLELWSEIKN